MRIEETIEEVRHETGSRTVTLTAHGSHPLARHDQSVCTVEMLETFLRRVQRITPPPSWVWRIVISGRRLTAIQEHDVTHSQTHGELLDERGQRLPYPSP